jgi:hypothetical protein
MSDKRGINSPMLVTLDNIKTILNNLENSQIMQYEGCVGSQVAIESTPYQTLELKIVFVTKDGVEQNGEEKD